LVVSGNYSLAAVFWYVCADDWLNIILLLEKRVVFGLTVFHIPTYYEYLLV